ncbi:glycosyltransferase family 2 protein [Nocardioides sp. R-C-SC26]|uniref:glycosyltransferase family 2 protein n=1 Tax=Nocardioides sp. R-C-SC26 TaxID=2870414 RepID=UPI001E3E641D|nr:glycosyltransferase family 2 protein [Nocardioides sp. R-C-SC26]
MAASVPHGAVAVLLVSHDGEQWLPGVLEGLAEQGDLVGRVIAVDTGSRDQSPQLLEAAFADAHAPCEVLAAGSGTSYPTAVALGMARLAEVDPDQATPWVWLLHDDARPAPDALRQLLNAARQREDVAVLGPKLREWPSLRRILEIGVTISGTGRRETGLERGEYDQGQHDQPSEVLAVNTAGMLVRRSVLEELGGFDENLPIFGNDLDFGWRAAAAGHTTLVVPRAVVFHAEASHRGVRRTPLTGRHTHYQERRAALWTLLVNGTARSLPWRIVRLTFGTVLRMLGFLLVRSPGEALDDLAALVSVLSKPGEIAAARRRRAGRGAGSGDNRLNGLLAPWWLPYRHGLDFVGDLVGAAMNQAADVAERRRLAAAERDPASFAAARVRAEEDDELTDSGALARFLTNPVAVALTVVAVGTVLSSHVAWGAVSGGALSPAPTSSGTWWSLHLDASHALGLGSDVPAPAYVVVLAAIALVTGPQGAISLLLLGAVPVALWGAWRFLRVAGRLVRPRGTPRAILAGGAITYALVPLTSGAWGQGRLGLVVAAALVPWIAHAAVGFLDPDVERRRRAGWRAGALLTIATAFTPLSWLVPAVLVGLVVVIGRRRAPELFTRGVWGPPVLAVALPWVVLLPWWLPALLHGAGPALLLDTGRLPSGATSSWDFLAGRLDGSGAPQWLGLAVVAFALLALVPRATRVPVALCWLVALVATLCAVAVGAVEFTVASVETPAGLGIVAVIVHACLITAVMLGAQGVRDVVPGERVRIGLVALAVAAAAVPVLGWGWFVTADTEIGSTPARVAPAYIVQNSEAAAGNGVLVLRGTVTEGVTYSVRRGEGVVVGQDEILALTPEDAGASDTVRVLVARPTDEVAEELSRAGIAWVVQPAPADGAIAAVLDSAEGLVQVSSEPGTRAWQVVPGGSEATRPQAPDSGPGAMRSLLILVQMVAAVVAAVQCAPTIRAGRGVSRATRPSPAQAGDAATQEVASR